MMVVLKHRGQTGLAYNGIPIHSPPHIHEEAFCTIKKHLAPGSQVIDLGAGSGAFTKRLADAGMVVEAVDFDATDWSVPNVLLRIQDLTLPQWDLPRAKYDAAIAIEVIEHIENPSAFLRNIRELLRPGGLLLLTTPNVVSVQSRRLFLLSGKLAFFGPGLVFSAGHMTILPYWLLEDILRKESYTIVERSFIGRQGVFFRPGRSFLKTLVVPFLDLALWAISQGIPRRAAFTTNICYICMTPKS